MQKQSVLKNQKGQTLIEYLIIIALVGVGSIALMRAVGQQVNAQFAQVIYAMGGTVEGDKRAATVSESSYKKKDLKNFINGAIGKDNNTNSNGASPMPGGAYDKSNGPQ